MIESFKKNQKGIYFICISSVFACVGQLLWKLSSDGNIWLLLFGFGLYGLGALVMLIAYKFGSLSVIQPFLSLNYVLSIIFGYFFLNEVITLNKIIGIIVIMVGVTLIAGGDKHA